MTKNTDSDARMPDLHPSSTAHLGKFCYLFVPEFYIRKIKVKWNPLHRVVETVK